MKKSFIRGGLALGLFGSLAGAAVGCGGGESVDVQPSPYRTEAGFCAELAEAVCTEQVLNKCYLSSSDSLSEDMDRCIQAVKGSTFCNPASRQYHQDPAESCVKAYGQVYRDARIDQNELDDIAEACNLTFNDGRPEGNTCQVDADCAFEEGLRCVGKPGGAKTCRVPVEVAPGDACGEPEEICEPTHYCGPGDGCIVRPGEGDACDETVPCGTGTTCLADMCVALRANGQNCGGDEQCSGGFCITPPGTTMGTCGSAVELASTNVYCEPFLP